MSNNTSDPTPQNYPIGQKAKEAKKELRDLRELLKTTKDPSTTISKFTSRHSLHNYLAKAFQTKPRVSHNKSLSRKTRGEVQEQKNDESRGVFEETFQPESVFTFCNHLGVTRYDMHKTISDALKSALENEIDKVKLPSGSSSSSSSGSSTNTNASKKALLNLLESSWQFISVPELRSVFVTVMKKLGDETPKQVLIHLASKKKSKKAAENGTDAKMDAKMNGSGGTEWELKYEDLLNSFGFDIKRLVWEADWDSSVRGDGFPITNNAIADPDAQIGTLHGRNVFVDIIRPAIEEYRNDEMLKQAADLAYTTINREKRFDTQQRRAAKLNLGDKGRGKAMGGGGKLSALTSEKDKSSEGSETLVRENATGLALSSLKDATGSRPKLLAAILNILIAEHGNQDSEIIKSNTDANINAQMKIVAGSSFLHCTLLADVLLSYGQLPRQFEHVRLLAQTLDECVQKGIISDKSVGQIQKCVRAVFQPDQDKDQTGKPTVKKDKDSEDKPAKSAPASSAKEKQSKKETKKGASSNVRNSEAERQFELKLLRKIIKTAVAEMKENDPQGLFLNPVTDDIAPGYSRVIKNPMCVRTIEDKAVNQRYSTLGRYEIDVQLMFQNCIKYNIGKEGTWFRGEAKRQQKKWRDEILKQKKDWYKSEMAKRKKQLDNASSASKDSGSGSGSGSAPVMDAKAMEEKKKKEILLKQQELLMGSKNEGKKRKHESLTKRPAGEDEKLNEMQPLSESKAKKRKKDTTFPSMPALASMLLSDPFVVRLLLDKVLRAVKNDVLRNKNIPAEHGTIPSVLQLLHIADLSTKVCRSKGKVFYVPDAGLVTKPNDANESAPIVSGSFAVLRKQLPKLATLFLSCEIDKRIAGGDLQILPRLPPSMPKEWQIPLSSQRTILDLVEGALVHLLQPGANETALLTQCPRFFVAINALSNGNMTDERCFFASLTHTLLRQKTKLPHSVRDMIVNAWLGWFKSTSDPKSTMTSAVHLCFMSLLNEWAALGNLILPVDTQVEWSLQAIQASEANAKDGSLKFVDFWNNNLESFAAIKKQYERMLKGMPEDRSMKWKEAVGLEESSESQDMEVDE